MRQLLATVAAVALLGSTGCVFKSKVNLGEVASNVGFQNVTTGDGTFENYKAVSYERASELGIGLGIFGLKLMELYPAMTNEGLLQDACERTKEKGANAMINVRPQYTFFFGFIIGAYWDSTAGTGIDYKG